MVKVKQAIVVEGRYDKNVLAQIVDAPILQTNGFGIMHDRQLLSLLRSVAKKRGLIVFTDSDGAGFVIRNFLKSAIEPQYLLHAYIPDVIGKEKRKKTPGKEGKLGVEGMTKEVIIDALRRAGATLDGHCDCTAGNEITKQDLVDMGLSGGKGSAEKRKELLKYIGFPEHMSSNAMLQALNVLYAKQELLLILKQILEKDHD